MNMWSIEAVENAVENVCSTLDIGLEKQILDDYKMGKYPNFLIYEKLRDRESDLAIPAVQKYLISCRSYLEQPCQYYDIFRACRHVTFLQVLSNALRTTNQMKNHEEKFSIIKNATNYEELEACIFELAVAHQYISNEHVSSVCFVERHGSPSPDLLVSIEGSEHYIECKRYNRASDVNYILRNVVREKLSCILHLFKERQEGALFEISFHKNPKYISNWTFAI